MNLKTYRAGLLAGGAAAVLAAGPALAAGQTQQGETAALPSEVMEPLTEPEWQVYDQLDTRYGPRAWLTFGEVIGSDVEAQQGETVGEIDALVRAKSDGMFYALVDVADAPADYVAIPVDQLKVVGESEADRQIVLAADSSIDGMPAFEASEYEAAQPTAENKAQQ